MQRLRSVATLVFLLMLPGLAHGQDADPPAARVLASAGIAGRFGEPICRGERTVEPHPSAAFTGPLLRRASGLDDPLVVDTGGLLAPHGVARFAARDLPDALADLVVALHYDALAFGENDLGAPRPRTILLARTLAARGVPYVATNLHCDATQTELCDVVLDASDPVLRLEAGTERVALVALLDPEALVRVAPDRSAGLSVDPIAAALPSAVRAARAADPGALVVAVLDTTSDAAFDLARELPDDGRPDLVLLAGEGDDLLFAHPASVEPAIVSPPPGHGAEVIVHRRDGDRLAMRAEQLAEPGQSHAAAVSAFAAAVGRPYCDAWGTPLAGGRLAREIAPDDVAGLAARIVREFAGADVAFLNTGAIDSSFHASDPGQLTGSDFYVALSYDEPLMVADVPASWLFEALGRLEDHGVLAPGLAGDPEDEESLRIRGRPPVAGAGYRVATIRFLAEGGDDALPPLPEGSRWTTLEHTQPDGTVRYHSLRDVVLRALERPDPRDPRDTRPSPDDPPEWVIRGVLDGDFAGSTVSNPAEYDAALLDVESTMSMGVKVDLHVDMTAPLFTWENRFRTRYRTQWAPSDVEGEDGQFVESLDQIWLRTMGSFRGLRAAPSDVWIPDLYVEAFLESELTRPETRDWHWLLVRPTAGVRFALTTELDVKLQAGLQAQALAPDAEAQFGAGASILLRPWTIIDGGERSLTLEGTADFFAVDLGDRNDWQLRAAIDSALDLAGPLALVIGATLYAQQDAGGPVGVAFTATAGLRLTAITRAIGP